MNDEQREKIYSGAWIGIPDVNLLEWLKFGEKNGGIEISRLMESATTQKEKDRISRLRSIIAKEEESLWIAAKKSDNVADYQRYLAIFGEKAIHAEEARNALLRKDRELWGELKNNPSPEGIENYRKFFPNGIFIQECREMEEDLPWFIAKKKNTIEAYQSYKIQFPWKHDIEIERLIEEIKDESSWKIASTNKSKIAYIQYIDERAGLGKKYKDFNEILEDYISYIRTSTPTKICNHYDEARSKIEYRGGKEILLDELRKDPNKYSVIDLKNEIDKIADMQLDDLIGIFTDAQVQAIKDYKEPKQLAMVDDPNELPRGFTEVYFWGLRKTGKTCAIGATIGYLSNIRQSLKPEPCPGVQYLLQLQNLFSKGGKICTLPPGTPMGNLPAMAFSFNDKSGNEHRVTFIDVAGEVFSAIYAQQNGLGISERDKKAIEDLEKRLRDSFNNKIHFFIIEYGDDNGEVEVSNGLYASKSQIMQSLASYFAKQKIFDDSSVSMNLLVTKCDRIREGDRMEEVIRYVNDSGWGAAAMGINEISIDARTGCLYGMGFSIGEVFAQDLCVFCPDDAEGIVDEIEQRTPAIKHNWWSRLIDSFRRVD